MKFSELNLEEQLLEALDYMGYEKATPIQQKAIPVILNNQDLLASAQTGTGKTGAFLLPILNKLIYKKDSKTDTLIIVPTRELAIQIEEQIEGLSYFISVGSIAVYGGGNASDWEQQKNALKNGTDIIVATPGKLLSHLKLGYVDFKSLNHLILDEADKMLNMGFIDDLKAIISYLPKKYQTLMFSATMPKSIEQLARKILKNPEKISLAISKPAEGINQKVYLVFDEQKAKIVKHILSEGRDYQSTIVFTSTKSKVSEIVKFIKSLGFRAQGISSNLDQNQREEVLRSFRSKQINVLVATDVMSRGIDIKGINRVINFDVPHDPEDYVHRVGRTARANTKGEAFTLVNPKEMRKFQRIERLIKSSIEKLQPPEKYGKGPEWKEWKPKSKKKFYRKKSFFKKK